MIGGKITKEQLKLIQKIENQFPEGINWISLVDFLGEIIDILEIKDLNLNPNYIDELIFFYGAHSPSSKIKTRYINFILKSNLSQYLEIDDTDNLNIILNSKTDELFNEKVINQRWEREMENLKNEETQNQLLLKNLEKKLMNSPIPDSLLMNYPILYQDVFMNSKSKSYMDMSKIIETLENEDNQEFIEKLYEELDRLRNKYYSNNKNYIALSDKNNLLRKKISNTRRGKLIPKYISKPNKIIRRNKKEQYILLKLIQHVITGFISKYSKKYPKLKTLFIETVKEIPFDNFNNTGRGFSLTRLPFQNNTFQVSPREAAIFELNNSENIGKGYGEPGYISESGNRIQFSGLEPFTLKPLLDERDEINWWINRLSESNYPSLDEKKWIYQYYK